MITFFNDYDVLYKRDVKNGNIRYIDNVLNALWHLIYVAPTHFKDGRDAFVYYRSVVNNRVRWLEKKQLLKDSGFIDYFLQCENYLVDRKIMYIINEFFRLLNYNIENYYLSRKDIYNDIKYFLMDHFKTI